MSERRLNWRHGVAGMILGGVPAGLLLGTIVITEVTYLGDYLLFAGAYLFILAGCFWLAARQ